jgi:UDP-GlcNAc:undecaprenyl-phosphate/decaprenyl-phosphate GlcNAc-1-phosphate transferase
VEGFIATVSEELTAVVAFAVAFATALTVVPAAIAVAWRTNFLDRPVAYKRHGRPTPYLGGVAVMAATVPAALVLGGVDSAVAWILAGAALLAILGTIDDRVMLGPVLRLVVEAGLGALLWATGFGWSAFNSDIASLVLTIVWIVGLVNAFNLMDNLDGATGTLGMICALGAGNVALLYYGSAATAALAFALSGACAGFLIYNLKRPARIFLGDGGSMPIGFVIAAVLMAVSRNVGGLGAAAIVAVAPLVALPILDTTLVLVSRTRRGVSLLSGGRDHLTHRLLGVLGTPRRVALVLAAVQAALCVLGLALLGAGWEVVVASGIAYIALGSLAITVLDLSPGLRPDPLPSTPPVLPRPAAQQESAP